MLRTRWFTQLALLLALVLVVAACAPDDADEPEDEPDVEEPEEDEEEPDEPEVDEEEEVDRDDASLTLGYILPETGQLAFLGPAQIQAVEMAVSEIEDAGGVLGNPIDLITGDEAGDAAVASETAERLLGEGVNAVVGAAATGMSLAIIDQITGAGVLQCSASNTGPVFTDYDDDGLYFRTAPSDALQGPVLAETIVGDGGTQVAIAARGDDYGEGLLDATRDALEEQGADVVEEIIYDPEAASFDSEVEQLAGSGADAIALISFEEGVQILQGMIEAGIGPGDVAVYGADGIRDSEFAELVDPGDPNVLDGMKGTAPDPDATEGFLDRFDEFSGGEEPIFSAQAYDCTNLIALAAEAAGSTDGSAMAGEMVGLLDGDNECGTFEECVEFVQDGETIAYDAASGMEGFTDAGDPTGGTYEVWEWADGELTSVETVSATVDE